MTDRPGPLGRQRTWVVLTLVLAVVAAVALVVGVTGQQSSPPQPAAATGNAPSSSESASRGQAAAPTSSPPAPTEPADESPSAPVAAPVAVRIPVIDVDSVLTTVGLNPDGTLEVPQPGPDYDKAAWFRESPRPGEVGPAVIEGHVDSAANGPSVFYDLGKLAPGDRAEVTREDGSTATFEVYDIQQFPKDEFPTLAVYGNTDGPELRLITCGGPFSSEERSYEDNIVIFASLVDEAPA